MVAPYRARRAGRPMAAAAALLSCALGSSIPAAGQAAAPASTPAPTGSPAAAAAPKWYDTIRIKGYVQLDALFPEGSSTFGHVSNFRVRRARPTIQAMVDPRTIVQIQFDVSTGKALSGGSTALVTDTFAERAVPGFGHVRVGHMLIPFSREIIEDNAAIRSPLELSYVGERLALAERDIGLLVEAPMTEARPYGVSVGLYNGQGFRTADANSNKTVIGRATARLGSSLQCGLAGMLGSYRATASSPARDYDRHVLVVGARVRATRAATVTGELYNARFVDDPNVPTRPARFTGGYLLLETAVPSIKSTPWLRYQRTYGDLDYRSFDVGWRYDYTSTERVTLEYDIVRGPSNDGFGARWTLFF